MWFRVRESHPPNHVTHWSFHHVIFQIPTFARAKATSFSKMWLKLSYRVTWFIYHVITLYRKRCISSFSTPRTITMKLGRVMSYGEGTPSILSINLTITWLRLFWTKKYIHRRKATELLEIPNIEKLTNQKLSLLLKKILTLNSYRYKPL